MLTIAIFWFASFVLTQTVVIILPFTINEQWRIQVDQAARPFQFIHYDPIIQR